MRRPKSFTTTAPTLTRAHALGDLAEGVLRGDLDHLGAHDDLARVGTTGSLPARF